MAPNALSEEDERVLRTWREGQVLHNPRLESKALLKIAAMAMVDEEFRARLVNDTEAVLRELQTDLDHLEGVTLRFYDNTPTTLNVVLPPRAGEVGKRSSTLRDALRSRTSETSFWNDDFDHGDFADNFGLMPMNKGDTHTRDGALIE